MSILNTIKETLEASTSTPGANTTESKGAYWCHPCGERILDLDVEGDGTPDCPECGAEMSFERSTASTGCAC